MKKKLKIIFMLLSLTIALTATAHRIQAKSLEWDSVSAEDLKGYNIYQTTESGDYGPSKKIKEVLLGTIYEIPILIDGTYFWVITAFDNDGNESGYSNEVSWRVDTTPPEAPILRIIKRIVAFFWKLRPWNKSLRIT